VRSPFVERPGSVSLVFVEAGGVRYVAANLGFGFAVPVVLAMIPWGFLMLAWVADYAGVGTAWQLFLAGLVLAAVASAAVSLSAGTSALRHVLRVEFSPPAMPERVRLVRPSGSTELPVDELKWIVVVNTEQQPYGTDDAEPATSLGVEVELHTANGTVTSPGRFRFDADRLVERLEALLEPAGVAVERREVVVTRRPPPNSARAHAWWDDERVAADWGVPVADVPQLVHLLRVHHVVLDHSLMTPGRSRNDPAEVARVTAAVTDGTMTRAVAAELLTDLNGLRRPLSPRARAGSGHLAAFLPQELAAAYRAAVASVAAGDHGSPVLDAARRDLALAVLGEPAPAADPAGAVLDALVRRALYARPYLPYGTSPQ
jgi:hypothetical protein